MRPLVVALAALALSGCATTAPQLPDGERFAYACAGSKAFAVAYDKGFTYAVVTTDRARYQLPAAMAASGARYSDGRVEFWEKGPEAMLNGAAGGPYNECVETNSEK
jgi:membrane-bound inhibitor of C-type lysozyme